uniref:G-protein coupled receptors family 1 profile domain-containing protein n=1 Tax=Strongyloides stercoralis TaxID=6248 RepID=A0A0K0DU05_STRER
MHVWNSYNKNYFYAAIELIFLLIPSFIPNIYFLKIAIFQKTLKKRPILRYSIIIQATQYICSTTLSLSITLLYLFAVYNGTKIHMLSCSLLRCFQHLLLFSLSSTPLILAITRNYIIVLNKKLNNISILVLGVIFNSPTLCVLYNFFLNHTIVVDHEICGKIIEIENMTIGLMSILCTSAYPFLTVFVNTITYLSLKQQYLRISIDNKFKHEKEVLINLCIQSMIPLISQAPMLSLLLLSYINHWESDYFLWRITDLIYYTHFIYVIFLSTYFIKEIRLSIIPWLKKDNSQISFI